MEVAIVWRTVRTSFPDLDVRAKRSERRKLLDNWRMLSSRQERNGKFPAIRKCLGSLRNSEETSVSGCQRARERV